MRPRLWTLIALAVLAPLGCADETCLHAETRYRDEALSRQLTKDGVRHSVQPRKGVCVPSVQRRRLEAASREVDAYFPQVAELLRDACEERALVAWASREGLRFEVADATSSTGKPSRLLLIRSFSREEAKANLQKLKDRAPRDARCGG